MLVYGEGRDVLQVSRCSRQSRTSLATIRVTVFVVVVTLVVVIIVVGMALLWTLSVVEIGGFFTTCCFAGGAGLSRQ